MSVRILTGDVFEQLALLPADSFDCVVTSPPYWGLRDYGVAGQIGLEPTLGEHLDVMVRVFSEVRRVMKPTASLWLNYGDCYATKPNGRSAADTKAVGNDDRTFRDKPFSTVGPILQNDRRSDRSGARKESYRPDSGSSIAAGGFLKPKDLCMIPNRLAIALQDDGWWVRSEIIWGKSNPMPDSSGRYRPSTAHEKIFLLTKSGKSFYDAEEVRVPPSDAMLKQIADGYNGHATKDFASSGAQDASAAKGRIIEGARKRVDKQRGHSRRHDGFNDRWDNLTKQEQQACGRFLRNYERAPVDVWEMATAPFSGAHFATFPPELVSRALSAGCPKGGSVLDPFGGSGTVGMVADRMGISATLIELNPSYVEIARERVQSDAGMFAEVSS